MSTKISVILKATGVFAMIIIGAGLLAAGAIMENDGVKEAGVYLLGIGVFIVIVLGFLSYKNKKNYFK